VLAIFLVKGRRVRAESFSALVREILPVAVDVQVRKVTEYLGVARTRGQALEKIRRYAPVTRASVVDRR